MPLSAESDLLGLIEMARKALAFERQRSLKHVSILSVLPLLHILGPLQHQQVNKQLWNMLYLLTLMASNF